jgi:iron(III) transport system ATP-binding protein
MLDARQRRERVSELLGVTGLDRYADHYPHQLSGGQQQRVALARALAPKPDLLLLDEPFSNLDVELRERLSVEVRDILKQQGLTAILVTHDQNEAFNIADQVGIVSEGRIVQWATPYDLYHQPASRFVADFVGQGVFLPGTVLGPDRIQVELGPLHVSEGGHWAPGTVVDVLLRPDDVLHDDHSDTHARVVHKAFRGAQFLYTLETPGGRASCRSFPATTTTRSARTSAYGSRWTTSSRSPAADQRSLTATLPPVMRCRISRASSYTAIA